jgi:hypothetical protein
MVCANQTWPHCVNQMGSLSRTAWYVGVGLIKHDMADTFEILECWEIKSILDWC